MELLLLYAYSYFIGAIPTAYIIGRIVKGIDLRDYGSGNVGGTNLFMHVGKWWILPHSIFEFFGKGASPIWLGVLLLDLNSNGSREYWSSPYLIGFEMNSLALAGASLLAIAGHNWSVFLKFQGGRGIAPASGAFLAIGFYQFFIFILGFLAGWSIFRSSATVMMIVLLLLPVSALLIGQSYTIAWYFFGVATIIALKRLTANGMPDPASGSTVKVLVNRLVKDRDISDRNAWIHRTPKSTNNDSN